MYDGPDMPTTDLPEDHCGPEPVHAPLDVSRLAKIPGYEGVGYYPNAENSPIISPTLHDDISNTGPQKQPEEGYKRAAAKDMIINKITLFTALNYTLETYTETRHATWEQEPYEDGLYSKLLGMVFWLEEENTRRLLVKLLFIEEVFIHSLHTSQAIDGPTSGIAPGPWIIKCHPTQMFKDEMHSLEVPHTACVMVLMMT
ncbi:hypothetical protein LSH36_433g02015 [Paralvinella palmiformis]|uniref:Uncharacterized protein n=1 Tax=Paralvinella palmiformis TaxID=53620 RepID=A0AAD9MXW9_9ANNE|nr:hypothetical protein LSH36_433g02015 [Paralvinella palmiformis]